MPAIEIRPLLPTDWPAVGAILAEGIATGNASFEATVPTWDTWDASHLKECRWVAEKNGEICGWVALSGVSSRCVYGGIAELSVYVAASFLRQGIASLLMKQLIVSSESAGLWTLQAGIFPENEASIRLHLKHGFRRVGQREKVGQLKGQWRDTVLLERRSKVVGI